MSSDLSFKHFIHGWMGGMTGLALSHPIDTIKSNVQTGKPINYNTRSLYKGMTAPMLTVGFDKAMIFWCYGNFRKVVDRNYSESSVRTRAIMAGMMTGLVIPFYLTPIDRIKIIRQTNGRITRKDLSMRFMYRGLPMMLFREPIASSVYFLTFESLKDRYRDTMAKSSYHHIGASFLFGGISGCTLWTVIYPFDIVKTIMQSSTREHVREIDIAKNIYKQNGFLGFYRGYKYAIMRAIPRHAGTFAMVEYLRRFD